MVHGSWRFMAACMMVTMMRETFDRLMAPPPPRREPPLTLMRNDSLFSASLPLTRMNNASLL